MTYCTETLKLDNYKILQSGRLVKENTEIKMMKLTINIKKAKKRFE
eukprot:UN03186